MRSNVLGNSSDTVCSPRPRAGQEQKPLKYGLGDLRQQQLVERVVR